MTELLAADAVNSPRTAAQSSTASPDCKTVYALRRTLVRRLQAACQGVPRRRRFARHRAFIDQWAEYSRTGRLGLLISVLEGQDHGGDTRAQCNLILALAQGFDLNSKTSKTNVARGPDRLAFWKAPAARAAEHRGSQSETAVSQTYQPRRPALQADLFGPGLVTQPS